MPITFDNVYEDLLAIVSEAGARSDVPIESETFFSDLTEKFDTETEYLAFVRSHLAEWFVSVSESPNWLQDANWQFSNKKPMVFVGQTEIPKSRGWFHDDACMYLFGGPMTERQRQLSRLYRAKASESLK